MEDFMKGYLISLEGPDGAGKSTTLKEVLKQIGPKLTTQYIEVREPGGSKISEKIRQIILDPHNQKMDDRTEALLYAASRSQLMAEVVIPALKAGKLVISDRFVDSSLVYQGAGRDLGMEKVKQINDFATRTIEPDLTLFFDLDPKIGLARIQKLRPDHEDRLEQEKIAFHEKVYQGYQKLADLYPQRIVRINANQDVNLVVDETIKAIENKLPQLFQKGI